MFFANPLHPYSVALMSAVPTVKGGRNRAVGRIKISGDPSSPINPQPGCRFADRCPMSEPACAGRASTAARSDAEALGALPAHRGGGGRRGEATYFLEKVA